MGALGEFQSAMDAYFDGLADAYWSPSQPCCDCEEPTEGRCVGCAEPVCLRCESAEGFCPTCAKDAEALASEVDEEADDDGPV